MRNRFSFVARLVAIAASCLVAGSLAAWQFFPEVAWGYWQRVTHSQSLFSQPERVLSGRIASWQAIGTFLAAHPWHAILGIGYKTLPYSGFIGQTTVADNMYLSLLVEPGIVGLALVPLILAQGGHGTQWIGEWALASRLEAIPQYYLTGYSGSPLGHGIEALVAERTAAKKARNFARADEIRNELAEKGVVIEDSKDGVRWKRK